jgi:hypothetical protein
MLETLDWRMVTASPIDGFLSATAEALKALVVLLTIIGSLFFETNLDNILFLIDLVLLINNNKYSFPLPNALS